MKNKFFRQFLLDGGIIGGVLVVGLTTVLFLGRSVDKVSGEIAGVRATLAEETYLVDNLAALKQSAAEARDLLAKMDMLLPLRDDLLGFPRFVEGRAQAYGVGFSFSFEGEPQAATPERAGHAFFLVRVSGGYDNILNFIEDIERRLTRFLVHVDTVTFTEEDGGYRALIRGKVFFR